MGARLAACGGGGGSADPGDVALEYADATSALDAGKVCDMTARSTVKVIEAKAGKPCEEAIVAEMRAADVAHRGPAGRVTVMGSDAEPVLEVDRVDIEGNHARVLLHDPREEPTEGNQKTLILLKEDGVWKVEPYANGWTVEAAGDAASCKREREQIEKAVATRIREIGETPENIDVMIRSGQLDPGKRSHEVRPDGTVVGIGPCA